MFLGVGTTSDDSHILIHVGNQETTELLMIPASDPTSAPVVTEPRQAEIKYELDHWGDRWVIRTNADGAVDFRLAQSTATIPTRDTWSDLVPHVAGHYITGFAAYDGHLVRLERRNACDRIIVMRRNGA